MDPGFSWPDRKTTVIAMAPGLMSRLALALILGNKPVLSMLFRLQAAFFFWFFLGALV